MASTVQCTHCDNITTTTVHTQDISLHIDADSNTSLGEKLHNFFQPETLEGENAYWCDTCHKPCRATKTLSFTHIPTILIIYLKRLILGRKIQTHVPFDTVLDMKPYLAPGQASTQTMELIGIIAHQGTKEQGHYVSMTKRGNKWISHNDAIVAQATLTQLLQTQAYIMTYRKMEHNGGTGTNGPKNSIVVQESTAKRFKLLHKMEYRPEESPPLPGPWVKFLEQTLPHQQGSNVGDIPQPSPIYGGGLLKENLARLDTLLTDHPNPQVPETRGEDEVGGVIEPDRAPSFEKVDHRQTPPVEVGLGQSENENTNLPQIDSQSKTIPHDSHIKLIDGLSEDPEDHPVGFIPTIERHNARLEKAYLLHEATRTTIEQKWSEGVMDVKDVY